MTTKDLKTIYDVDLKGKLVFLRNDFNVPLDQERNITDLTRIKASLLTLEYLIAHGARVVCSSHLGRPEGQKVSHLSLKPIAETLSKVLNKEVKFTGETIGNNIEKIKNDLLEGEILLLENLRFFKEEKGNGEDFAKKLSLNIDLYVNDAFGACHRAHASIDKITRFVPQAVAGLLVIEEIEKLSFALESPPEEYVVILGGTKVSGKIPIISNLLPKAKYILIGGAMAYTFLKAMGLSVGSSKVEEDFIPLCKDLLQESGDGNARILLPVDHVAATKIEPNITVRIVDDNEEIPDNMMGLDIGIKTTQIYSEIISQAKLILWNGPMGVFEIDTFLGGTIEIAKAVAHSEAVSIIGGGDLVAAVNKAGVKNQISHISTGGGASLEFLAGKQLPGITALL